MWCTAGCDVVLADIEELKAYLAGLGD